MTHLFRCTACVLRVSGLNEKHTKPDRSQMPFSMIFFVFVLFSCFTYFSGLARDQEKYRAALCTRITLHRRCAIIARSLSHCCLGKLPQESAAIFRPIARGRPDVFDLPLLKIVGRSVSSSISLVAALSTILIVASRCELTADSECSRGRHVQ